MTTWRICVLYITDKSISVYIEIIGITPPPHLKKKKMKKLLIINWLKVINKRVSLKALDNQGRGLYEYKPYGLFKSVWILIQEDILWFMDQTLTLSFLSQRNLSFCAFLCMNTPSKCPVSAARISIALFPQPIICPVLMYAEKSHPSLTALSNGKFKCHMCLYQ